MVAPKSDGRTDNVNGGSALAGLRVLDMTRVLAAPSATRMLAELGADVVKADLRLGGGRAGLREPFFHEAANRGKRLVEVDLQSAQGRARLTELLRWAGVFVTNFTLPALRRMGIDEETVGTDAPDLIYVYINAFGTEGPWADLRGYAEIANTVTGLTARTLGAGPPSGVAPTVDLPRTPFTDYAAGILGAYAATVAYYCQLRAGRNSSVNISLVTAASYAQLPYLVREVGEIDPDEGWTESGWTPLQHIYRSADSWLFVGVAPSQCRLLLDKLGLDDKARNEVELASAIAAKLASIPGSAVVDLV